MSNICTTLEAAKFFCHRDFLHLEIPSGHWDWHIRVFQPQISFSGETKGISP